MTVGPAAERALCEYLRVPALVLALGSRLRGDDAAGAAVWARARRPEVVDCGVAPERYLGLAERRDVGRVLFVDAMDFGGAVGELAFCRQTDLVERAGTTHHAGLAVLMRFVEQAYGKPTAVLGIQPGETKFGAAMCAAVQGAAVRAGQLIEEALAAAAGAEGALDRSRSGPVQGPFAEREAAWNRS